MRGLDFDPAGDYLVVLLSGGSAYDSPSVFKILVRPERLMSMFLPWVARDLDTNPKPSLGH